ncbi:MAG: zinc dependent phospholipase C family protein [Deltaproteobacteria bacterium]|nr:zinc dependent phospholipase C family protein [Deltaproteobacteria bacterium]
MISISLIVLGLLFFLPGEALAWGPATHIHLGSEVLKNLTLLAPSLQRLLSGHPSDYLYGCIGADIIFGKKFTPYSSHCHNWKVGMEVLAKAETDPQISFAYGYLSHLAHDIVAHNYYIPTQLVASFQTRTLRHGYWETRFDTHTDKEVWDILRGLAKGDNRSNDDLLERVLENNILPFNINKQIFASWLLLHRVEHLKNMVSTIASMSKWPLSKEDVEECRTLSLDITIELLTKKDEALCLRVDPTGRKSISLAKDMRKRLKGLEKGSSVDSKTQKEIMSIIQPRFRESMFSATDNLEVIKFPS